MKVREWIRNGFVVAALSTGACIPAQAALLETDQSVVGIQSFDYTFTPTLSGLVTAIVTDLARPIAFDYLRLDINVGPIAITPAPTFPGEQLRSFPFSVMAHTTYSLSVFAAAHAIIPGSSISFGKYHLTVSDPEMSPVPEPGAWLMLMLGGIGLLGWMRLRRSGSFG